MDNLELLEKLIENDKIEANTSSILRGEYTHSKMQSSIGGTYMAWLNLSQIIYVWVEQTSTDASGNGIKKNFGKEILEFDGEVIKYNPTVIQDYLHKNK